jgi:hypothetical protein
MDGGSTPEVARIGWAGGGATATFVASEETTMEQTQWLTLVLQRDGILTLALRGGAGLIRCVAGRLWITVDGNPEDHLLLAGDERAFRAGGRAVIQAMSTATVRIRRPALTGTVERWTLSYREMAPESG